MTEVKAGSESQGKAVVLPNGKRRIDFIRDQYYKDGKHSDEEQPKRGAIKTMINDMLKEAGREGEEIQYQIVFAATKTNVDPRIASAEAATKRAKIKADREEAQAKEKAEKVAAKEKEAQEKAAQAEKAAAKK